MMTSPGPARAREAVDLAADVVCWHAIQLAISNTAAVITAAARYVERLLFIGCAPTRIGWQIKGIWVIAAAAETSSMAGARVQRQDDVSKQQLDREKRLHREFERWLEQYSG